MAQTRYSQRDSRCHQRNMQDPRPAINWRSGDDEEGKVNHNRLIHDHIDSTTKEKERQAERLEEDPQRSEGH